MAITPSDLLAARAVLHLHCRQCGKIVQVSPESLARRHGAGADVAAIVLRMRCDRDGMLPDAAIVFDNLDVSREAARRRLSIHSPTLVFKA